MSASKERLAAGENSATLDKVEPWSMVGTQDEAGERWGELHAMKQFYATLQPVMRGPCTPRRGETHRHTFLDVSDIRQQAKGRSVGGATGQQRRHPPDDFANSRECLMKLSVRMWVIQ